MFMAKPVSVALPGVSGLHKQPTFPKQYAGVLSESYSVLTEVETMFFL